MSLISSMNPTAPINTRPESIAAARASAIAIFIGVAWGIVGVIYLATAGSAAMEAALADAAAQNPDAAGMSGMAGLMTGAAIGTGIFLVIVQLVLGLVQWFKPNIVIPILFTVLVVYGLGSTVLGMAMMNDQVAGANPMWFTVLGLVVLIVELVLHIAGIRGANALNKMNKAEQTVY